MFKKLSNLFRKEEIKTSDEESLSSINRACSSLLIEVALSDKNFDQEEIKSMTKALINSYGLSEITILELIDNAQKTVDESTSLYSYTREINDTFGYEHKLTLLDNLWDVAIADGNIDKYEERLIRKISDLLYISHSDFIKVKLNNKDKLS